MLGSAGAGRHYGRTELMDLGLLNSLMVFDLLDAVWIALAAVVSFFALWIMVSPGD